MKRIRCPKCEEAILFDETAYEPGRALVFECPACNKQFRIRVPAKAEKKEGEQEEKPVYGRLVVVENVFHFRQEIPLHMGENVVGRHVRGTSANAAITTVDPSVDTTHCIISVGRTKAGQLQFLLRDAPSNTGTFCMDRILGSKEKVRLEDGDIITIGATTMIFHVGASEEGEE